MKPERSRIVVVMPAYNAGKTLARTCLELPPDLVDQVIVVDDASADDTVQVARGLDLRLHVHDRNRGYGAGQKTGYREALREGAAIIVMLHPDWQHDPRLLPDLVRPILDGRADLVLGSRFMGDSPVVQGMPRWRYLGNRLLTGLENAVFGLKLTEFHTGYRAFRGVVLESIPYALNSDRFVFDQQIIAQSVALGFRIAEVSVPTRYPQGSSSIGFFRSLLYAMDIVWMLLRFAAHRSRLAPQRWLTRAECTDATRRSTAVSAEPTAAANSLKAD